MNEYIRQATTNLRRMSNRLWVRLSFAIGAVVLFGVMMTTFVGLLVFDANQQTSDMAAAFNTPGGPVDTVQQYLERNPDSASLGTLLAGLQSAYPQNDAISITFSYIGADGSAVFNAHPADTSAWPEERFDGRFPIVLNGEEKGLLRILRLTAYRDWDPQNAFFGWLREDFGLVALIGTATGILAGIVISRSMAAPLRELAATAHALGQHEFSSRVTPSGSTEMVQVARAFNDMAAALEQGETLRRNLVADVAHELRTPLSVLQGSLRAMLDDVYAMDKTEVASLYDQTRVLSRLVNDLHELAQAEANQLPLNKQPVDLGQMVSRITGTFAAICEDDRIDVVTHIPAEPAQVYGDAARLSQVLNNLLNNALHHTPADGSITVGVVTGADTVLMTVEDTGRGIPQHHLPHVFERFYRVDRARSRHSGGAGLGLAIVRAIVEAHDGRVWVESTGIPGQGTRFSVEFPRYRPNHIHVRQAPEEERIRST
ncbi:MAG: ATP-binding protein [Chloroflexota bacterium]